MKSGRTFFDKDLRQLIDIERFLFDRRIPCERESLESIPVAAIASRRKSV